jgi:hypothetical protein
MGSSSNLDRIRMKAFVLSIDFVCIFQQEVFDGHHLFLRCDILGCYLHAITLDDQLSGATSVASLPCERL